MIVSPAPPQQAGAPCTRIKEQSIKTEPTFFYHHTSCIAILSVFNSLHPLKGSRAKALVVAGVFPKRGHSVATCTACRHCLRQHRITPCKLLLLPKTAYALSGALFCVPSWLFFAHLFGVKKVKLLLNIKALENLSICKGYLKK